MREDFQSLLIHNVSDYTPLQLKNIIKLVFYNNNFRFAEILFFKSTKKPLVLNKIIPGQFVSFMVW